MRSNGLLGNLQHPNEFVRGMTLRFMAKVKESELLESLLKAIRENLSYHHPYVRRNAVLAVASIYKNDEALIPDAPELIEAVLEKVRVCFGGYFGDDARAHCSRLHGRMCACLGVGARPDGASQRVRDAGDDRPGARCAVSERYHRGRGLAGCQHAAGCDRSHRQSEQVLAQRARTCLFGPLLFVVVFDCAENEGD